MNIEKLIFSFFILFLLIFSACKDESSDEGDRLFRQGKFEEAIEIYTEYLRYNPQSVKSLYNRGRSHEELGQYEEALEDFGRVLKIDEKNINALMSLGKHHYKLQEFNQAIYYFEQAIEANVNNSQAYFLKGRAHHKAGDVDEAMDAYNNVISLRKDFGDVYLYRGLLNINVNRKGAACSDFKKAASLDVKASSNMITKYCE